MSQELGDNPTVTRKMFSWQRQGHFPLTSTAISTSPQGMLWSQHTDRRATKKSIAKEEYKAVDFKKGTSDLERQPAPFERQSVLTHPNLCESARSRTSIQTCLYLNKHDCDGTWMDICCRLLPTGQSVTQTPKADSLTVFPSSPYCYSSHLSH